MLQCGMVFYNTCSIFTVSSVRLLLRNLVQTCSGGFAYDITGKFSCDVLTPLTRLALSMHVSALATNRFVGVDQLVAATSSFMGVHPL